MVWKDFLFNSFRLYKHLDNKNHNLQCWCQLPEILRQWKCLFCGAELCHYTSIKQGTKPYFWLHKWHKKHRNVTKYLVHHRKWLRLVKLKKLAKCSYQATLSDTVILIFIDRVLCYIHLIPCNCFLVCRNVCNFIQIHFSYWHVWNILIPNFVRIPFFSDPHKRIKKTQISG